MHIVEGATLHTSPEYAETRMGKISILAIALYFKTDIQALLVCGCSACPTKILKHFFTLNSLPEP